MITIRKIFLFIVLALMVVLLLQNIEATETRILFWSVSMPRAILLLTVLLVGFLSGYFTRSLERKKNYKDKL